MILEGIVTTVNEDGSPNISPMGPLVENERLERFTLRPFQTSTTYRNLKRHSQGVLHVTDDVELFVDGALRDFSSQPAVNSASQVTGWVLEDCCRHVEFEVVELNDENERTEIQCRAVNDCIHRMFWGFNRAKHAVLEAAILATRLHLIEHQTIRNEIRALETIVKKTAGAAEFRAFAKVQAFVENQMSETSK